MTSLHFAANKGYTILAENLVNRYGASIESLTIKKQTPMHMAAAAGMLETVEKLVDMEARVATKIFEEFGGALSRAFIRGREPVSIIHYTRPGTCINHPQD